MGLENQFFVFFLSGCLRQVSLYITSIEYCIVHMNSTVPLYIGSYMSAHVLLNLLNKLRKSNRMGGLPSILSLSCNSLNKFNMNVRIYLSHDIKIN